MLLLAVSAAVPLCWCCRWRTWLLAAGYWLLGPLDEMQGCTSVFCSPAFSSLFPIVPVLSSEARMPLPGAARAAATSAKSEFAMAVGAFTQGSLSTAAVATWTTHIYELRTLCDSPQCLDPVRNSP